MPAITRTLKIAAIQMIAGRDWRVNLATATRLVAVAAATGASLVILPEFFIQITTADDPTRLNIAEELGQGPLQTTFANLACQHGIYLLAGTLLIKSTQADKFYNTAIVYDPNGNMHAHYQKIHLFKFADGKDSYDEGETFLPGTDISCCEILGFRIGLAVCYDLRFPELFRQMGVVDAIILPSAFTYTTGKAHWEVLSRARAIENQCYFIAVNQGGEHETGRKTYGHTLVSDPWGEVVAACGEGEHVITVTLDQVLINQVRTKLPALQHRRVAI